MPADFTLIVAIAGAAAVASPLGGLLALRHRPSTNLMSMALGFASGVLLATIGFEMLPQATRLASLPVGAAGFAAGFLAVYLLDLFVHRGRLAGDKAQQSTEVRRFHRRHRPRGDHVTVLAGGTAAEEIIEGLSIGAGAIIDPSVGMLVGLAVVIDNLSEGLSIGELVRGGGTEQGRGAAWRVLRWTGLIGVALFGAALAGWLLLRDVPHAVLGFLFASGAGGMLYLTVTDLLPQAEAHQYQQSGAIATGAGFLTIFVLSSLS